MAMPHERSRTLHNFTLPNELKWGNQKHLRCMKLPQKPHHPQTRSDSSIEQVRHKLIMDFKLAVNNMTVQIIQNNDNNQKEEKGVVKDESLRPWNLRTRRSPAPAPEIIPAKEKRDKRVEREKFSVSLKKEEIETDYMEMFGTKPPRRPKKRLKVIQKQLDTLFPGLWLTEVTPEMYEVVENQE